MSNLKVKLAKITHVLVGNQIRSKSLVISQIVLGDGLVGGFHRSAGRPYQESSFPLASFGKRATLEKSENIRLPFE